NGEIYNYVELRIELERAGQRFWTKSDTEVILAGYRQWGVDCVHHFNGMWAFALWDKTLRQLFCSRDRVGEKPFFYALDRGQFAFASEMKALFAFGIPKESRPELLDAYLCFTYIPEPQLRAACPNMYDRFRIQGLRRATASTCRGRPFFHRPRGAVSYAARRGTDTVHTSCTLR